MSGRSVPRARLNATTGSNKTKRQNTEKTKQRAIEEAGKIGITIRTPTTIQSPRPALYDDVSATPTTGREMTADKRVGRKAYTPTTRERQQQARKQKQYMYLKNYRLAKKGGVFFYVTRTFYPLFCSCTERRRPGRGNNIPLTERRSRTKL